MHVFEMELDAAQDDNSKFRLYRRLLFSVDGNKSVGAQVSTINDKLYVGLGKFWRQDGWKANRWAPGKKGSHIFLTADQYRALVSAVPKISNTLQLVENLIEISANEFEDISDSSAAVANAGSGTIMSGTEPASFSADFVSAAATADSQPTSAVRGADACDGNLEEPGEPSADQDKDKKTQDVTSSGSKRKRGRPSKVSGKESATPKTGTPKSRKTKSGSSKRDGNTDATIAQAAAPSASGGVDVEHGASITEAEKHADTCDC